MNIVQRIEALFGRWGRRLTTGPHRRQTLLEHSLRCAELAQSDQNDDAMVAAALLHDLGRVLAFDWAAGDIAHWPEIVAARFLAHDFGPDVVEPIRLQRTVWCCLANVEPEASRTHLQSQLRPMSSAACLQFVSSLHGRRAVQLCCYIRQADLLSGPIPSLKHFLGVLERVLDDPRRVSLYDFKPVGDEHRLLCEDIGTPVSNGLSVERYCEAERAHSGTGIDVAP